MNQRINKKVAYAIRMYNFHTRLTNKYLEIIQDFLEKKGLLNNCSKSKQTVLKGQISIFDEVR